MSAAFLYLNSPESSIKNQDIISFYPHSSIIPLFHYSIWIKRLENDTLFVISNALFEYLFLLLKVFAHQQFKLFSRFGRYGVRFGHNRVFQGLGTYTFSLC